ncbi:dTDP-4-dehydrorhamnose 3,5-epimerase family protein, partial [Patescibacteria group bacterium]|nr:dTDP-4-dehydrorhamnose 3,5-epimerase family protein [Patescibacteria group bacterium]
MIHGVEVKKIVKNKDERGWLAEIFRDDELACDLRPVMAYVSVTKPGVIRGPHEHKEQTDVFVFLGPGTFELHLWDNRKDSPTFGDQMKQSFGQDNSAAVKVPPGVVHGYKNIGDKQAWCINLPNRLFKGRGKKQEVDE